MTKSLYFYSVGAYGYDDNFEKQYFSHQGFTQQEFEEIVFNILNKLMREILDKTPSSLCFYNIFFMPDDLLSENRFDELMMEEGFQLLSPKILARINFTTNMFKDNKFNERLYDSFCNLEVDESCRDNNCNRIDDLTDKEKKTCSQDCGLIFRHKMSGK